MIEHSAPDEPALGPGPSTATVMIPRAVVMLVMALLVGLVAAVAVLSGHTGADDGSERARVAEVAGRVTAGLFSFDYHDLSAPSERLRDLMTSQMATEVDRAFAGTAGDAMVQAQAIGSAVVKDVLIGEIGADSATAITVMDLEVSSVAGPRRTVDNFVILTLVRTAGGWRVSDVATLNGGAIDGLLSPPDAAASTPSTSDAAP